MSSHEKNAVNVTCRLPHKSLQLVNRYAEEYNMSRANMLVRLIETGLLAIGEQRLERTSTLQEGVPSAVAYPLRKIL